MRRFFLACLILAPLFTPGLAPVEGDGKPRAYVFDHDDPWTTTSALARLLREANFEVTALPLDRSPAALEDGDLIAFGSFASEHPDYATYMQRFGSDFQTFVEAGRVLLQMTQADQTERAPPFLPSALHARRGNRDFAAARVLSPNHRLLEGVQTPDGVIQLDASSTVWEGFTEQSGFEVLMAGAQDGGLPALMEGELGRGRVVLAAMAFDKDVSRGEGENSTLWALGRRAFAAQFFANLQAHCSDVAGQTARPVHVTPGLSHRVAHTPGSWTLAVLPDTQNYSLRFPGLFLMQTAWILRNRERLNIRYVVHLGDIVNHNTPEEWEVARQALGALDGHLPYALVPGNHDYGPRGDASTRDTLLNEYFPSDPAVNRPGFGAMEEGKLDNTWHRFDLGGRRWILLALEWGPRPKTLGWANAVMRQHSDCHGILVTHAYLDHDDKRYDHTGPLHPQIGNPHLYSTPGGVSDGEELWQNLVRHHRFDLVLCGHVLGDGTGYLATKTDVGNTCHQMLSNYQMRPQGGEGYLRLLEFLPDGSAVQVRTYSPLFDRFLLDPDQHFHLTLDAVDVSPAAN